MGDGREEEERISFAADEMIPTETSAYVEPDVGPGSVVGGRRAVKTCLDSKWQAEGCAFHIWQFLHSRSLVTDPSEVDSEFFHCSHHITKIT